MLRGVTLPQCERMFCPLANVYPQLFDGARASGLPIDRAPAITSPRTLCTQVHVERLWSGSPNAWPRSGAFRVRVAHHVANFNAVVTEPDVPASSSAVGAEQITRLFTEPRSTRHKSTTNEPSIRPGSFTELPHEVASGRACSAHPHSQSPRRPSTCESMRATGAQTPVCFHRL